MRLIFIILFAAFVSLQFYLTGPGRFIPTVLDKHKGEYLVADTWTQLNHARLTWGFWGDDGVCR